MKSFRVRIALWTTLAAGAVMLVFGVAGNIAFDRVKLRQVDDALRAVAERVAAPPDHFRYWDRMGEQVQEELQRRLGAEAVVAVYGYARPKLESADEEPLAMREWGGLEGLFAQMSEMPEVRGRAAGEEEEIRFGPPRPEGPGLFGPGRNPRSDLPPPEVSTFWVEHLETGALWRVALARHQGFNGLFAINYENVVKDVALMRRSFAVVFPVALLALAGCIWYFVTRAIRPVGQLAAMVEKVSAQRLDARLPSEGSYSEFAPLIEHFNGMLERLEGSFAQAMRFSADAAHELKTPLAILQGQLEVALQNAQDGSDEQVLLAGLLDETHRLGAITRKLLILAKADAGALEAQSERVDLRRLLQDVLELMVEDEPEALIVASLDESVPVLALGDETLIRQILSNLLGNAMKYRSPSASEIFVELRKAGLRVEVEVENACEALSVESRGRLFDRFVRADTARSRSTEGTGLGLSLSLEFAKAQGGNLEVVDLGDERRMRVRLSLPAA